MNDKMIEQAKEFYKRNGHLFVHKSKDKELNEFLDDLRIAYTNDELPQALIEDFNKMGFVWRNVAQAEWEYCFDLAKEYNTMYKTLNMPKSYECKDIKLGEWLSSQVKKYHKNELSLLRYEKLDSLNINWEDRSVSTISFSEKAVAYYITKAHSDTLSSYRPKELQGKELDIYIPSLKIAIEYDGGIYHKDLEKDLEKNKLCAEAGITLIRIRGKGCPAMNDENCICINQPQNSNIGLEFAIKEMFKKVNAIIYGMREEDLAIKYIPVPEVDVYRDKQYILKDKEKGIDAKMSFDKNVELLAEFYKENKHCVIPLDYQTKDGVKLGEWLNTLRNFYKDDKSVLTKEQASYLDKVSPGWESTQKSKWLYNMSQVTFKKGSIYIPKGSQTIDGKDLYKWFDQEIGRYYNHSNTDNYKANFYRQNGLSFGGKAEYNKVKSKIIRAEYKPDRNNER